MLIRFTNNRATATVKLENTRERLQKERKNEKAYITGYTGYLIAFISWSICHSFAVQMNTGI